MTKSRFFLLAALLVLVALVGCRSAHTTSAIIYNSEQNYDRAVEVIHEGFQYGDDEPDAFFYLGEAYSHLAEEAVEDDDFPEAKKNYTLAYEAYMRTLELNTEDWAKDVRNSLNYNYGNRVRQAALDLGEGFYEQAEGHLRLAYASLPDSLTPIKSIARMKMQIAEQDTLPESARALREEALELLNQALEANPEAYGLNVNKANVLDKLDRDVEARALYDVLLAEHGDDTGLLMDFAALSVDEGDYARAADFYITVVDLNEADTDGTNDDQNKAMLLLSGKWYSLTSVGRFEDAIIALDRAAEQDMLLSAETMQARLSTYYKFGMKLKNDAAIEEDEVLKGDLMARSTEKMGRAVEIGIAMTDNFPAEADGFLYLSMAQVETGDFTNSEANYKTFQELSQSADF